MNSCWRLDQEAQISPVLESVSSPALLFCSGPAVGDFSEKSATWKCDQDCLMWQIKISMTTVRALAYFYLSPMDKMAGLQVM